MSLELIAFFILIVLVVILIIVAQVGGKLMARMQKEEMEALRLKREREFEEHMKSARKGGSQPHDHYHD